MSGRATQADLERLTHAELLRLCGERSLAMHVTRRDIAFARWQVASDAAMAAMKACCDASQALVDAPVARKAAALQTYFRLAKQEEKLQARARALYTDMDALRGAV